jgi:DNA-binding response OmpR family regulator
MMPGLDGWEVARRLSASAATRTIPVVFLSARADASDRRRGYDAGALGYITKPFDVVTLSGRIESIVAGVRAGESDRLRAELARGE